MVMSSKQDQPVKPPVVQNTSTINQDSTSPPQGDALTFFIEELNQSSETLTEKIQTIQNSKFVAASVGPTRTRTELLPLLTGLLTTTTTDALEEADDEMMYSLAGAFYDLVDFIGGESFIHQFVPPLEILMQKEETIVREKALESCIGILEKKCSPQYKPKLAQQYLLPVLERLFKSEVFTSRVSACGLIPAIYPHLSEAKKTEVRNIYCELCRDETPMARRAAVARMKDVFSVCSKNEVLNSLMPVLNQCWKDPLQDLVRASAVSAAIELSSQCSLSEIKLHTEPIITGAAKDRSWRVRLAVVQGLDKLMSNIDSEFSSSTLVPMLRDFILDQEIEVQTAAVVVLESCIDQIDGDLFESEILPAFTPLLLSTSGQVKAKLSLLYGPVAVKLGRQKTLLHLCPQLITLMSDTLRDVRLGITSVLSSVCGVLGPELSTSVLLQPVTTLMNDPQWRIRLSVVQQIPKLASVFGAQSFFKSKWEDLYYSALLDNVSAVRDCAIDNVELLGDEFGSQWTATYLLPHLIDICKKSTKKARSPNQRSTFAISDVPPGSEQMSSECRSIESYLSRVTLLRALERVALVVKLPEAHKKILSQLLASITDEVPNVRFTTIRILANLSENQVFTPGTIRESILPVLMTTKDNDLDLDVKYFSVSSIERCQQVLNNLQKSNK